MKASLIGLVLLEDSGKIQEVCVCIVIKHQKLVFMSVAGLLQSAIMQDCKMYC